MLPPIPRIRERGYRSAPNHFVKKLPWPEAEPLGELYLIRKDLQDSYDSMRLFFEKYYNPQPGTDRHTVPFP